MNQIALQFSPPNGILVNQSQFKILVLLLTFHFHHPSSGDEVLSAVCEASLTTCTFILPLTSDFASFFEWVNTKLVIKQGETTILSVSGEVSNSCLNIDYDSPSTRCITENTAECIYQGPGNDMICNCLENKFGPECQFTFSSTKSAIIEDPTTDLTPIPFTIANHPDSTSNTIYYRVDGLEAASYVVEPGTSQTFVSMSISSGALSVSSSSSLTPSIGYPKGEDFANGELCTEQCNGIVESCFVDNSAMGGLTPATSCRCLPDSFGPFCAIGSIITVEPDFSSATHVTIDQTKVLPNVGPFYWGQAVEMSLSDDITSTFSIYHYGQLTTSTMISPNTYRFNLAELDKDGVVLGSELVKTFNTAGQLQFKFGNAITPYSGSPSLTLQSDCEWYQSVFKAGNHMDFPCYIPGTASCNIRTNSPNHSFMCTCKDPEVNPLTGLTTEYKGSYCHLSVTYPTGPYYRGQMIDVRLKSNQINGQDVPAGTTQPEIFMWADGSPSSSGTTSTSKFNNELWVFEIPKVGTIADSTTDLMTFQFQLRITDTHANIFYVSHNAEVANPCLWAELTHHHTVCYNAVGTSSGLVDPATLSCVNPTTHEIECQCANGYNGPECSLFVELTTRPDVGLKYDPKSLVEFRLTPRVNFYSGRSNPACRAYKFTPIIDPSLMNVSSANPITSPSESTIPASCTWTTYASTFSYQLALSETPSSQQSPLPVTRIYTVSTKNIQPFNGQDQVKLTMADNIVTEARDVNGLVCPGDKFNAFYTGCLCKNNFFGPDCSWFVKFDHTLPRSYLQPPASTTDPSNPTLFGKSYIGTDGDLEAIVINTIVNQQFQLSIEKVLSLSADDTGSPTMNNKYPVPKMSQVTLQFAPGSTLLSTSPVHTFQKVQNRDDRWLVQCSKDVEGEDDCNIGRYKHLIITVNDGTTTTRYPTQIRMSSTETCNIHNTLKLTTPPSYSVSMCECYNGFFGSTCDDEYSAPSSVQIASVDPTTYKPLSPGSLVFELDPSLPTSWKTSPYLFFPNQFDTTYSTMPTTYPELTVPITGNYNLQRALHSHAAVPVSRPGLPDPILSIFHRFSLFSSITNDAPIYVYPPLHSVTNPLTPLELNTLATREVGKQLLKPSAMTRAGSTVIITLPVVHDTTKQPHGPITVAVKYYPFNPDGVTLSTTAKTAQTTTFPYPQFDTQAYLKLPTTVNSQNMFIELSIPLTTQPTKPILLSSLNIGMVPSCFKQPADSNDYFDIKKWTSSCSGNFYCSFTADKCICKPGYTGTDCTTSTVIPSTPTDGGSTPKPTNPSQPSNPTPDSSAPTPNTGTTNPGRVACNQCNTLNTASCDQNVDKCVCKLGWEGTTCSVQQGCKNESIYTCSTPNGFLNPPPQGKLCGESCTCIGQWTGLKCQTCPLQCQNGGYAWSTCDRCGCPEGYLGTSCECRGLSGTILINGYNLDLIAIEKYLKTPLAITPDYILDHSELYNAAAKLAQVLFTDLLGLETEESVYVGLQSVYRTPTTPTDDNKDNDTTDTTIFPSTQFNLQLHFGCQRWNPGVTTDMMITKWNQITAVLGQENERLKEILIFPDDTKATIDVSDLDPVVETNPPDSERVEGNDAYSNDLNGFIYLLIAIVTMIQIMN